MEASVAAAVLSEKDGYKNTHLTTSNVIINKSLMENKVD